MFKKSKNAVGLLHTLESLWVLKGFEGFCLAS